MRGLGFHSEFFSFNSLSLARLQASEERIAQRLLNRTGARDSGGGIALWPVAQRLFH